MSKCFQDFSFESWRYVHEKNVFSSMHKPSNVALGNFLGELSGFNISRTKFGEERLYPAVKEKERKKERKKERERERGRW